MFEGLLSDAGYVRRLESGEPPSPQEKVKAIAERARAKRQGHDSWWVK